jgi:hypothetical protein
VFYAAGRDRLQTQVLNLLAGVTSAPKATPKALIAPHAGYVYSGHVAAAAFATLQDNGHAVTRVVLIGPAHYVPVRGIAAPKHDAFETPLGRVPVDLEALSKIDDFQFVTRTNAPHAPEHALEVELPFLQTVLPSFQVVPLVVGDVAPQDVALVLARLWGGPETLIVVSSDLSHYHSYETARRLDLATAAAIERGDWCILGPKQACGCHAVACLWKPNAAASGPGGWNCAIPGIQQAPATRSSDMEHGCLGRRRHKVGAGTFSVLRSEVAIMAQQKKRATVRMVTPTARGKVRKASKSARGKSPKRTAAKATPKKRLAKLKLKRVGAKKLARKKVSPTKPSTTKATETIIGDTVEAPAPRVITITEFEKTEIREEGKGPESPEETPPESEER